MWHEARRQERKIRGMLVDYRKRAERRRDYYEKIRADPTQFLQVHGRQCRIHLDPAIAAAADSTVMMPWQGNENNLIDRFDVRAHLDYIPPLKKEEEPDLTQEERQLNYERYRIIAQNAYLSISEEKFLKQLHLEEQFGYTETKTKKEPKGAGAAIGFNYEEGTAITAPPAPASPDEPFEDDNSDSDLDVDLAINVSKIESAQAHEMNKQGQHYGMAGNDFYSFLTNDLDEAESYKLAKEEEHEKALYSGRKSRRERRAHREKRLANRKISPPSYAAKESPTNLSIQDESRSPSRSPSPDTGKITYITSFGGDDEPTSSSKPTYADKVKYGRPKAKQSFSDRVVFFDPFSRSGSRDVCYEKRRRFSRSGSRSKKPRERSTSPRPKRRRSRSTSSSRQAMRRSRSRSSSFKRGSNARREMRSSWPHGRHRKSSSPRKKSLSRSRSRSRKPQENRSSSSSSRSPSPRKSQSRNSSKKRNDRHSESTSPLSSDESSPGKAKSKSTSPVKMNSKSPEAPAPPRIRYYGRKRSDVSSSESSSSSSSSEDERSYKSSIPGSSSSNNRPGNNSGPTSKQSSTMTVIERLRLKRQALINRQFKKDKIAEVQKIMKEKQAQQTREDELREMAIKLRRRQRELRHAYDRSSSSDSDRSDKSKKSSSSPRNRDKDSSGDREKDRRERPRHSSRDRSSRRESRKSSRDKTRRSRSRSDSRRRYDRNRDDRESKRARSPEDKETSRKLVDY